MSFLRMDRGIVRGKRFASRKKAGEYVFREFGGTFIDGNTPRELRSFRATGKASMKVDHVSEGSGPCRRVYRHGLLWRVTVADIWQSDHASMDDALEGVNPIGVEPGTIAPNVKVQSGADYD